MKKLVMILMMVFVASGVNAQDDVYAHFIDDGNNYVLKKVQMPNSKYHYNVKEDLMDAMLHCNNINALVDTIRSHDEEVFIVFYGYKQINDKHIIEKVSVEDFLNKRKKYNKYDRYYGFGHGSHFRINGLDIYIRNIEPNGNFKIEEEQKYYMTWLKNTNEREYILKMISEEESKRCRERREKRLSEIRKEIEVRENENIRQWMERNNYTPQTDVYNVKVKRWDVGAMNDEIEEIRKQLKK